MRTRRMPWKETGPFAERRRFIIMARDSDESFTAICDRFGISRQKGYKWLARFEEGGLEALVDRSRRPHSNSRAVSTTVVELIVELRQRRPRWGPRKLLAILERDYPRIEFPVASTVGSLLRVKGLVRKRRRRAPSVGYGAKLSAFVGPNSVWCADFKGQFLVAGRYCHPLTIPDGYHCRPNAVVPQWLPGESAHRPGCRSRWLLACLLRSRHARTARHSRQHQAQQPELRTSHPDAERCA
jgi:transposase